MNRFVRIVLAVACLVHPSAAVLGQIQVWRFEPGFSGCDHGWFPHSVHASGADFQVSVNNCITGLRIYAIDPSHDIGRVTVVNSTSSLVVDVQQHVAGPTQPGGHNFKGVHISNSTLRLNTNVSVMVTGDLTGSIDARRFGVNIGGTLSAPLRARGAQTSSTLVAGATTANGTLLADQGNISNVSVTGTVAGDITAAGLVTQIICGSLQANVTAGTPAAFSIDKIEVADDIGSPGNPVSITATTAGVRTAKINDISASAIYANITLPNTNNLGDVRQIITTSGPFVGSLTTYALRDTDPGVPVLDIAGDLDADLDIVTVERPMIIIGELKEGRTIRVSEDLDGDASLWIMASQGLKGQVIINAGDNTANAWQGPVHVGPAPSPITLSPVPNYSQTWADLGGGAVGLAPFRLHDEDCDPPNGAQIGWWGSDDVVTLRHYGPVHWEPGTWPVVVEWFDGDTWWDITEDFIVVYAGDSDRAIDVVAMTNLDFQDDIVYRITPVVSSPGPNQSILRCSDVDGEPAVEYYEYYLNL